MQWVEEHAPDRLLYALLLMDIDNSHIYIYMAIAEEEKTAI